MEILKLPAGRLATVFYKNEPQEHQNDDVAKVDMPSKMEKGSSDETLQTIAPQRSRQSARNLQEQLDRKGHTFAWKNISLDIKTSDGKKRLLDGIDGKVGNAKMNYITEPLITEAGWITPGHMTALMGVSGAGKVMTLNDNILLY